MAEISGLNAEGLEVVRGSRTFSELLFPLVDHIGKTSIEESSNENDTPVVIEVVSRQYRCIDQGACPSMEPLPHLWTRPR